VAMALSSERVSYAVQQQMDALRMLIARSASTRGDQRHRGTEYDHQRPARARARKGKFRLTIRGGRCYSHASIRLAAVHGKLRPGPGRPGNSIIGTRRRDGILLDGRSKAAPAISG